VIDDFFSSSYQVNPIDANKNAQVRFGLRFCANGTCLKKDCTLVAYNYVRNTHADFVKTRASW